MTRLLAPISFCLFALGLSLWSQTQNSHPQSTRQFNIHWFGVGAQVHTPASTHPRQVTLEIHDLGPNIPHLVDDRVPAWAWYQLDQNAPVLFHPISPGLLRAQLTLPHLNGGQTHRLEIHAFDATGKELYNARLDDFIR